MSARIISLVSSFTFTLGNELQLYFVLFFYLMMMMM